MSAMVIFGGTVRGIISVGGECRTFAGVGGFVACVTH